MSLHSLYCAICQHQSVLIRIRSHRRSTVQGRDSGQDRQPTTRMVRFYPGHLSYGASTIVSLTGAEMGPRLMFRIVKPEVGHSGSFYVQSSLIDDLDHE